MALRLALAVPDRVAVLILESASPGIEDPDERARRVTSGWPDASILFLNEIGIAQPFFTTVPPFTPHTLVQAFRESFGQTIGDGLSHDCVVVVVLGPEAVAQFLQADPAGYRERADMIGQPRFFRSDEVCERSAGLTAFLI